MSSPIVRLFFVKATDVSGTAKYGCVDCPKLVQQTPKMNRLVKQNFIR